MDSSVVVIAIFAKNSVILDRAHNPSRINEGMDLKVVFSLHLVMF